MNFWESITRLHHQTLPDISVTTPNELSLNTAEKKVGTRIAIAITLKVLISNGLSQNEQINKFLSSVKTDNNPLLRQEA